MTSTPRYDVVAIGNAIVDVIARADDQFITDRALDKGSMRLIDTAEAENLYAAMGPGIERSGGSAANTLAGMAALGRKCSFIGMVADDQLGRVFRHDLTALGVDFDSPVGPAEPPTARCLILVTPDGQRTMNTFLGASQNLGREALDAAVIADSAVLYLEGYLWNADASRAAMAEAIGMARAAGRKVAFTLSDSFVVALHGDDFRRMSDAGEIDILFANEAEITALYDARLFRMWQFYLAGAEQSFRSGGMVNFHIQSVKRRSAVPMNRDYIGAEAARLSALDEAPKWHLARE